MNMSEKQTFKNELKIFIEKKEKKLNKNYDISMTKR